MPALLPRSVVIAIAPASTTASAVAEPMAPAAPVTSTILSLRRPMVCSSNMPPSSRSPSEGRESGTHEHRAREICSVGGHGFRVRGLTPAPRNDRLSGIYRCSNIGEIAMAALALRKARGARGAFALERRRGRGPFRPQAFAFGEAFLQQHRAAVGAHARLRKPGDLACQRLRDFAGFSRRRQSLAQPDAETLLGRNLARSEEHTSELQSPVHLVCR